MAASMLLIADVVDAVVMICKAMLADGSGFAASR
jgi:hypothetical protein